MSVRNSAHRNLITDRISIFNSALEYIGQALLVSAPQHMHRRIGLYSISPECVLCGTEPHSELNSASKHPCTLCSS